MARFYGKIGFITQEEVSPGVWEEKSIKRNYRGDILRKTFRWENSQNVNDDLNISNSISIVADSFAYQNAYAMKYVEWLGGLWKITSIEIQRPRLILTIGGLYNGPIEDDGESESETPQDSS